MTTSSVQDICSITLTPEEIDSLSSISTVTLCSSPTISYTSSASSFYAYGSISSGTTSICIPPLTVGQISTWGTAEWVDSFPQWSRIEKMCEEYPGLKIAFENFKTVYQLVKDDYDAPADKKVRP